MGANTIGKEDIFHSGFQGTWVKNENGYFNNQYYINMVNESLPRDEALQRPCETINNVDHELCEEGQTTGYQWTVGFTGFNLNADMAIYKVCDSYFCYLTQMS